MTASSTTYSSYHAKYEESYKEFLRLCKAFAWIRLLVFIAIVILVYYSLAGNYPITGWAAASACTILLGIIIYLNVIFARKRDHYALLCGLCEKELKALQFDFLEFPEGSGFIDPSHVFSSDIDLFGKGSAFQYINRTVTGLGNNQLAAWFANPCLDPLEIKARQVSIKELAQHTEWRLQFAATGLAAKMADLPDNLLQWIEQADHFRNHRLLLDFLKGLALLTILIAALVIAGVLDYNYLLLSGLINLGITGTYLRKINRVSLLLGKTYALLDKYSGLFGKINNSGFNSEWLLKRIRLLGTGNGSASGEMDSLRKILQQFDSRNNILVGFFRNAFLLTDLILVIKMEKWRKRNKQFVGKWLEVLGEIDSVNSLASFAFNNPGYSYPLLQEGDFTLVSKELGHPLIPPDERICNDIALEGWHSIVVLTGANMAGKSTFLRTVGLNLVIAHTGAPVCAQEFIFKPTPLITSIRTNDSLIKHESYFYAELKKLKGIIEALEKGQEVFILLDEVLKGTNSNDKLNGSIILIKKLLQLKTSGIIATHDIALGELENEFPGNIINCCFEADISKDQLIFDYKLRSGLAKNMTALFLMKQMNIV